MRATACSPDAIAPSWAHTCWYSAPFQLADGLASAEDALLQLLQSRRREALGVDQRLLALKVLRDQRQVRLADLDVVAEDAVVGDAQAADAAALTLLCLELCQGFARVAGEHAGIVQLRREALADHAALPDCGRRVVRERGLEQHGSLVCGPQ